MIAKDMDYTSGDSTIGWQTVARRHTAASYEPTCTRKEIRTTPFPPLPRLSQPSLSSVSSHWAVLAFGHTLLHLH